MFRYRAKDRMLKPIIICNDKAIRTYTSTGVNPPWVTEQQTAPAKANLE